MLAVSPFKKGKFRDPGTGNWRHVNIAPATIFDPHVTDFALAFYDPNGDFYARLRSGSDDDFSAHTAALIYLAGQIRLGSAQCACCRQRQFTQMTSLGPVRYTSPIPFCISAGQYFHGICANCFAMGGSLPERLDRCSVSKALTFEEYTDISERPVIEIFGTSLFLGADEEEAMRRLAIFLL